jgi:hypothetical protein
MPTFKQDRAAIWGDWGQRFKGGDAQLSEAPSLRGGPGPKPASTRTHAKGVMPR